MEKLPMATPVATEGKMVQYPLSMNFVRNLDLANDQVNIYAKQYDFPAIRESDLEKSVRPGIKAMVARCFVITGCAIPEDATIRQMLYAQIEQSLLENTAYSSLNFSEIEYAFRLNAAGNLGERVKHWQNNFNLEYFGQIMDRYLEKRADVRHLISFHIKPPEEKQHPLPDWKYSTELCYQEFLSGKFNMDLWPWQCYDEIVKVGWADPELYEDFLGEAKAKIESKIRGEYQRAKESNLQLLMINLMEKLTSISEGISGTEKISNTAKVLAMHKLFTAAKEANYKHLFVQK